MKTISLTPLRALSTKRRLVFIDKNVSDCQTLIQGVLPDSEVYLLDVQQDGISQITARLQGEPIDSIHLVAHGYPEGLVLGNSELNLETLSDYAPEIEQWACDYLIIYGCQTGAQGQLIERLQELTGAAVAASSSEVGPQWRLDVMRGVVDTPLAFREEVLASYPGVLATFTVSSTNDSGDGSLRDAIALANERDDADEIIFNPSLTGETISLTSGIEISNSLVLRGLGAENLTIEHQDNLTVFSVYSIYGNYRPYYGDSNVRINISGLTIVGGVVNEENLTITDSVITGSVNAGIENLLDMAIINSIVSGNERGGIINIGEINTYRNTAGELSIDNSTISDNQGTGIANRGGDVNIVNSTISGNSSNYAGGGILNSSESRLNITNSTISGNKAENGGGIFNIGILGITNSTITQNQANEGSGLLLQGNFDEYYQERTDIVSIGNTIVAGNLNTDVDLVNEDPLPQISTSGGNIIGTGNAVQWFNAPGDAIGVTDPGLEPLGDNGGITLTHGLRSDSPAINGGMNNLISGQTTEDQRGEPRIQQGFVDIGALESDLTSPPPLISLIVVNPLVNEGDVENTEGLYRINRTGDPSEELIINLTAVGSEGLDSSDFNLEGVNGTFPNYTVTIPSGEYSTDIIFRPIADTQIGSLETLTLNLEAGTGYRVNEGAATGTVSIIPETSIVTNTNDNGPGSLREAIALANTIVGPNTIEFDPSLTGERISLTSGELVLSDVLYIKGLGADNLTLDALGRSRIFVVEERNSVIQVSGLTITGGSSDLGGGIHNNGSLTITASNISGNQANSGGAIYDSFSAQLNINDSTISRNIASNSGGGISSRSGNLRISNSTISTNSANSGGGIDEIFGNLSITNSTITLNQADVGSGLRILPRTGNQFNIGNTVISDNSNSDLDLVFFGFYGSTPFDPVISSGGNLIGTGNALEAFNRPRDTIGLTRPGLEPLADNGGPTSTHAPQSDSPVINNGSNALVPPQLTTDQRGLSRIVGPRVDIGAFESDVTESPLPTVALLTSIPFALEGGSAGRFRLSRTGNTNIPLEVFLEATASSGLTESDFTLTGVSGNLPNYSATIPAGSSFIELDLIAQGDAEIELRESLTLDFVPDSAYRVGSSSAVVTILPETFLVNNTNDSGPGSLREAITIANILEGNNIIEFAPSLAGERINLTSEQLKITDDVVITGLGADQLTIAGNANLRVFNVDDDDDNSLLEVSISELTVTGGFRGISNAENLTITDTSISGNPDGGIDNDGTLNITNSTISNNTSDFSFGASAINNSYGTVNISNSIISGNTGSSTAEIINNSYGTLTISNSTISENTIDFSNQIISNRNGHFSIDYSNISGNSGRSGRSIIGSYNGTLNISHSDISGNSGGGVENGGTGGTGSINNSTISGNRGGVGNSGTLVINNSTISGNISGNGSGGVGNGGTLVINNSTISGNSSDSSAGGIDNNGLLTINNSTISGNRSNSRAGGIESSNFGTLNIKNSTITLNQGPETGGLASFTTSYQDNQAVVLANTIISGNIDSDVDLIGPPNQELPNNITSNGGNLVGTGNALDAFNRPTDQINITNPGLAPLGDNGGPTPTHLPLPDSPAVDAGVNALIPPGVTTDQRGLNRIFNGTVDVGAVELQPVNVGTPGRDTLIGGSGDDTLTGFGGRDELTGGEGNDQFIYTSVTDGVDIITDFQVNGDKIVLSDVLTSLSYTGTNPIADSYLSFTASGNNTLVQIDPDGVGIARARDFIQVQNVGVDALNNPNNFIF